MAFGGSGFGKQKFAGANATTVTPHVPGTGFIRDFSNVTVSSIGDRGCGHGAIVDRAAAGGHIKDRSPA